MTTKEIADAANLSAGAYELLREDSTSAAYLDALEKQPLLEDAVSFLTHKMDTRKGVTWALACIRELQDPALAGQKNPSMDAAENWLKAPADPARWAANDAAEKSPRTNPADLVARGIFFSGGSIVGPQSPPVEPAPFMAQKFIAGAVRVTIVSFEPQKSAERYQRALAIGRQVDSGKPVTPAAPVK
ncbi:MAG: hypothetical protein KGN36_18140 [Acidobacteriota bacterium]|nr:hypothetical protein [Acidobacteriota bacterium]